jgi:hypothetical protein
MLGLKLTPSIVSESAYVCDQIGLMFNTTGFSDPWDSMQVGYIYAELSRCAANTVKKRISKKTV